MNSTFLITFLDELEKLGIGLGASGAGSPALRGVLQQKLRAAQGRAHLKRPAPPPSLAHLVTPKATRPPGP